MKTCLFLLLALPALVMADTPIDFELPGLDGRSHLLSEHRGDWVVVNYWATWCAPCRKEIPDLSNLHDSRDDIVVLGLAFEDTEVEAFERFLTQYPASYPILLVDTFDPPPALGAPRALPTTFLVDREGHLVHTWIGPVTSVMVTDWIRDNG
ncbi:MAG: TlpA family protein disulfide reductase [Wenzhouxiangella sp.]|nr:TlpA family protein disulfide reductase [Wenzhouxiangella sp.]MCH8478449.1 TlpA family protein disulfide reductase [Wenzhouxiangella sp.]